MKTRSRSHINDVAAPSFVNAKLASLRSKGHTQTGMMVAAFVFAAASIAHAGVTFSTRLVGTKSGIDEWEIDVSSFTIADATFLGNGITSIQGTITATSGTLVSLGTTTLQKNVNFNNAGTGLGGGSTWINFDSYAGNPVFSTTSIKRWTLFTTDPDSDLTPENSISGSTGYPHNLLGEVFITSGGSWTFNGAINTKAKNNVAFSLDTSGGNTTNGDDVMWFAGEGLSTNYGTAFNDQVLQLATPANTGNIAFDPSIASQQYASAFLWLTGDSPANLKGLLSSNHGGSTPYLLSTLADAQASKNSQSLAEWAHYADIGNAYGIGAPTLLLFYQKEYGPNSDFLNFTLPAGDALVAVAGTPEPASVALLAAGGLALLKRRVRASNTLKKRHFRSR